MFVSRFSRVATPFIPPPPKALARKDAVANADEPSTTTATKLLSTEGQRRRRKPERQMHTFEPKKPMSKPEPKHPITVYFHEQAETQKEDDFVFLLWGSADSELAPTYAVDVTIPDHFKTSANSERGIEPWISAYGTFHVERYLREEQVFYTLRQQYYAKIGPLRRHLFFRKVARVKVVKFRLISRIQGQFKVSMEPLDLSHIQKERDKIITETHEKMNWNHFENPDFDEDPDEVQRCSDCGHKDCDTYYELLGTSQDPCPGRQREEAESKLRWVQNADLLTFSFRNPSLALEQNMLSSSPYNLFAKWEYMKGFRGMHPQYWEERRGLYIETCFDTTRLLCTTIILLILVIILGKLAWGSWDIVFGAGSFFVAIPMLVLTALSYTDC